MGRWRQTA